MQLAFEPVPYLKQATVSEVAHSVVWFEVSHLLRKRPVSSGRCVNLDCRHFARLSAADGSDPGGLAVVVSLR